MMMRLLSRHGRAGLRSARQPTRFLSTSDDGKPLLKTALHDAHVAISAKMVPFAGYSMPVQYKESLLVSHAWCRESAGLFDVSHMGQLIIRGADRLKFLESLTPGDLLGLKPNQARLSVLTNEQGGILDDCVITNKAEHVYMVVNAGCKDKDIAHMRHHLALYNKKNKTDVTLQYVEDRSLLALQGPKAAAVLSRFVGAADLSKLPFMFTQDLKVDNISCWVTRCGYTGEDGFEVSVPNAAAVRLMEILLGQKEVQPAGLGVRDSLRLEAGLCLYGHDLNDTITPVEASLAWLIGKRRREQGGYPGAEVISKQLKTGTSRKRVGLTVLEGAPAREGAEILSGGGDVIGVVTSGTHSPTLKTKIAMGYIASAQSAVGTKVAVKVRGKIGAAEVCKMPFVQTNYFKG